MGVFDFLRRKGKEGGLVPQSQVTALVEKRLEEEVDKIKRSLTEREIGITRIKGAIKQDRFLERLSTNESLRRRIYLARYRRHPWIRGSIRKTQIKAAAQVWDIKYTGEKELEKKEKLEDKVRKSLQEVFVRPNPRDSFKNLLIKTFGRLKLYNEAHWYVQWNDKNELEAIYFVDGNVKTLTDRKGNLLKPAFAEWNFKGQIEFYEDYEIIDFVFPGVGGVTAGQSDLEALEYSTATDLDSILWNKKFFDNTSFMDGYWILPPNLSKEQVRRNKAEIRAYYQGVKKGSVTPVIVEGDTKFENNKRNPKDAEFLNGRKFSREEHSAVLGVPLGKLGVTEKVNRANMDAQNRDYIEDEIIPLHELVKDRINLFIKECLNIYDWEFNFKKYRFRDIKDSIDIVKVLGTFASITKNEARDMFDLTPLEKDQGGDEIIQGAQFTKREQASTDRVTLVPEYIPEKTKDSTTGFEISDVPDEPTEEMESEDDEESEPEFLAMRLKPPRKSFRTLYARVVNPFLKKYESRLELMRIAFLNELRKKFKEKEDYRDLDKFFKGNELTKSFIDFFKGSFLLGSKQIAEGKDVVIQKTLDISKKEAEKIFGAIDFGKVPSKWWDRLKEYATKLSESTISNMVKGEKTGQIHLRQVLKDGWKEGKNLKELTSEVNKVFKEFETWKAERIARTESSKFYVEGKIRSLNEGGIKYGNIVLGTTPCERCIGAAQRNPYKMPELLQYIQNVEHPNGDCDIQGIMLEEQVPTERGKK